MEAGGAGIAQLGDPLVVGLLLCYVGAVTSAFASSAGILGALIPLAVPFMATGGVGTTGLVVALAVSATVVDATPFSTVGALVVANANDVNTGAALDGLARSIATQMATYRVTIAASVSLLVQDGQLSRADVPATVQRMMDQVARAGQFIFIFTLLAGLAVRGVGFDAARWSVLMREFEARLPALESTAQETLVTADSPRNLFGPEPVNLEAPEQVRDALARVGVEVASTRTEQLRDLDHPAVAALLE